MGTKTACWNTGRLYSKLGQRISATLHDDGVITFYDHDRMVDGELGGLHDPAYRLPDIRAAVDFAYDRGAGYKSTARSWNDANGCNRVYLAGQRTA